MSHFNHPCITIPACISPLSNLDLPPAPFLHPIPSVSSTPASHFYSIRAPITSPFSLPLCLLASFRVQLSSHSSLATYLLYILSYRLASRSCPPPGLIIHRTKFTLGVDYAFEYFRNLAIHSPPVSFDILHIPIVEPDCFDFESVRCLLSE